MPGRLTVALDIGSSLGKGCWRVDRGSPHEGKGFDSDQPCRGWMTQANAVDGEMVHNLKPDSCTVELGDKAWTVGESAKYKPLETNTRTSKAKKAGVRVLGMLGKVLEQAGLEDGELDLRILLPVGESRSFSALEQKITRSIYEVRLNGVKPKLKIKSVRVFPEGAGVARQVTDPRALVLMCGHRDMSVLHVMNSVIQSEACQTFTGMGMIALINEFSSYETDELMLAEFLHLEAVGKKGLSKLIPDDIERSQRDFAKAKSKVWRRITDQFEGEPLMRTSPKIYVTGGSMRVWQKEFKTLLGSRLCYFRNPLSELVKAYPDFNKPENKELKPRFTDSFSLMQGGCNV